MRPRGPPARTTRSRSRPDIITYTPASTAPLNGCVVGGPCEIRRRSSSPTFSNLPHHIFVGHKAVFEHQLAPAPPAPHPPAPNHQHPAPFRGQLQGQSIADVSLPRMPSLSIFGAVENPSNPFSMTNAVIPLGPACVSVLAYTTCRHPPPLAAHTRVGASESERCGHQNGRRGAVGAPQFGAVEKEAPLHSVRAAPHAHNVGSCCTPPTAHPRGG